MSGRNPKRLFLLDATALAYRSHFAFIKRPLLNSRGRNVGALYAYTGTLLRIMRQESPDLAAAAFDLPAPTFRHVKYERYKATRDKTPVELVEQLPEIKAVTLGLGFPVLEQAGWEADDLIGTLARRGEERGMEVFIVGGDKDFMQLVSDRVKIYNIMRPDAEVIVQGIDEVRAKFGVAPERVVDVLGLMGDSSDNIPGVDGVGVKTAVKLIHEFGTMENLYAGLDQVENVQLRAKLADQKETAFLSRDLVTISTAAPVGVTLDDLDLKEQDGELLRRIFIECEFAGYLSTLDEPPKAAADERRYRTIVTAPECAQLVDRMRKRRVFALDLETTSLDPRDADIVGFAIALDAHEAFYIPAAVSGQLFKPGDSASGVLLEGIRGLFADPGVTIIGQNIKYDLAVLRRAGVAPPRARIFDTMVAHYLCHPGEMQHGLDLLSLKYLDIKKTATTDLIGKGKKQISMAQVPVEQVCAYACEDVDVTLRLHKILAAELEDLGLQGVFGDLEMPLLLVLEKMEANGVRVDRAILDGLNEEYRGRLETLTGEIHDLAGEKFNINSPQQLGRVLFDKLEIHKAVGLKRVRKTKTGYSTNVAVLESLAAHPLAQLLIEFRRLQKLSSTYVEALPHLIHPGTGCVHTSFNQAVAATGRLSSSDPNLQNIPIRTGEGRRIREAFVPRAEGWRILSADYSQVELRILAHISADRRLVEAFRGGEDIHRGTAALIFGCPPGEVTAEMRSQAKTINFGIIYGMGPHRLSRETGISLPEARAFIAAYFDAFPGVKGYIDRTLQHARETGFVSTLIGRRRRVDDVNSGDQLMRANAENIAVNTPIQGTAADLIKKAMIDIDAAMTSGGLRSLMILQVHDELVFDVPEDELAVMTDLVKGGMEAAYRLDVPLVVDIGVGPNWSAAH